MLKFSKMHGLGNDFIVIDAIHQSIELTKQEVQLLADRHWGIGCDQLLLVQAAESAEADFRYRIFNADGGEVAQCGNGARCFARFVHDKGLTDKTVIAVETVSGLIYPELMPDGQVRVDMGPPRFEPEVIPFVADELSNTYMLTLPSGAQIEISALSMGNPHAVVLVENTSAAPVAEWGPQIETHQRFPDRVNVGFMELVDRDRIRLRVYERGVGETQACGTGACAAVVSGIRRGLLARYVEVHLPGGRLQISWPNESSNVMMTGHAQHVFDGEIEWPILTRN